MKLRTAILLASTAVMPSLALAQSPAQPARPATAQSAAQAPAAMDFVNKATSSNLFEIQSSQLAMEKSQNTRVREFAQKMVQDHTGATDRLKAVAQGMTLPTNPDDQHSQMLRQLQGATGPDFDRRYVQLQLTGHEESVKLFDQYAQGGDNPQLKQFAQQTLPTLREHLQTVQQIRTQLPPDQTAQNQSGQGGEASRIVVQQPAPAIQVQQAAPQVDVRQAQPNVTVRQAQPEILVRQPQPTVTIDIPQPEIIVRMPRPEVNVAQAQPQVEVRQPQPQVQVVPQQQPQVNVTPAQPQVQMQASGAPNVQVEGADQQPKVSYERAEPKVVVNQAQGQPQVRMERQGEGQQAAQGSEAQRQPMVTPPAQQEAAVRPADTTAAPRTTGAVSAGGLTVSRINDMNLYNAQGNNLGDVERVVQGADGKQHIVIGAGGFLGMGEKHVAIPLERVTMRGDRLTIQGVTDDQIRAMPTFDRNDRSFRQLEGNQPIQVSAGQ